jgi:hypothetical protein
MRQQIEKTQSTATTFGSRASKEMREVATSAEQAEAALESQASATSRVRGMTGSLGTTASSTASQLSTDLVQSSQDAAFGLDNLAASAPFLNEQFQRLRQQTGGTTSALSALFSALKGPAGVIGAFTLLVQFGPQIADFFTGVEEGADDAKSAIDRLQSAADSLISGFGDELPEFEITDPEAAREAAERLGTAADQREQLIEDARRFRDQVSEGSASPEGLALGTSDLQQRFGDIENLDAFIQRQERLLENERAISRALQERLDPRERERRLLESIQEIQGIRQEVEEDQPDVEEFELPDTSFQAGEAGFVEPPNAPRVVSPVDLESIRTELTLLEDLENQIRIINEMPFLRGADKAEQRIQQVVQGIRQAQRAGREFSRREINQLVEGLGLAENEAQRVRQALAGGAQQGADSQSQVNQELVQSIQLASQLGATLVQAFKDGEFQANRLLGQILTTVGTIIGFSNPAAGAGIAGAGTLIGSFDEGGFTGPGAKREPAGIVHRGEYVMPQEVVRALGLDTMRRIHEMATARPTRRDLERLAGVPGYATGGLVGAVAQPASQPGGRGDIAREAAEEAAKRTAARVAEQVADRPVRLFIGGRSARDIQREADRYAERKNPRSTPDSQ